MRKILAAALAVFLLISLSACSGGKGILCGVETDYPVMIMVNGTLYYGSVSRYEGAVDETAVKTITSYTDAVPKKDGECNFDRSLKTKYILTAVSYTHLFPLEGSGSGIYTKNIALHLHKRGHEVAVVFPENQPFPIDVYKRQRQWRERTA